MKQSTELWKYFFASFVSLYGLYYIFQYWLVHFTNLCVFAALTTIAWTLAYFIYESIHTDTITDTQNKVILITGCDTGFGNWLAQRLDRYGFHIFAGVLNPNGDGAMQLKQNCSQRCHVVLLDVTNQAQVDSVVEAIKQTGIPLWAVVNNAGIGIPATFDMGNELDLYHKTFEVNLFGVIRITRACMPLLYKSKGRIINIASVMSRVTFPLMGHYCMTKSCVRVFSDLLRRELYPVNSDVQVISIEPTYYRTLILNVDNLKSLYKRALAETSEVVKVGHGGEEALLRRMENLINLCNFIKRENPYEVVDTLTDAVTLVRPKHYYRCCSYFEVLLLLALSHLPDIFVDTFLNFVMHNTIILACVQQYNRWFKQPQ